MVKSALKWMGALALVALVASSPLALGQEVVGIVEGDDYENAMMPEPVLEDESTFVEEEVPMYEEAEEAELGLEPTVTEDEGRECEERAEEIARRLEDGGADDGEENLIFKEEVQEESLTFKTQ